MKSRGAEAIVAGTHGEPFAVPGTRRDGGTVVGRCFIPGADTIAQMDSTGPRSVCSHQPAMIANFTPRLLTKCRLTLPGVGVWHEILDTGAHAYCGSGADNFSGNVAAEDRAAVVTIPPLATIMFEHSR